MHLTHILYLKIITLGMSNSYKIKTCDAHPSNRRIIIFITVKKKRKLKINMKNEDGREPSIRAKTTVFD